MAKAKKHENVTLYLSADEAEAIADALDSIETTNGHLLAIGAALDEALA